MNTVKELVSHTRGTLVFDWRDVICINNAEDRQMWREQFYSNHGKPRKEHIRSARGKRKVEEVFKAPCHHKFKAEEESLCGDKLTNLSTAGNYPKCRGVASKVPGYSRDSTTSWKNKTGLRSWYSSNPGGLMIKSEMKKRK